jgi:hypothetical protein
MKNTTPRPWRVSAVGEIKDDFGVTLAYLVGPGRNSEADGRLIAAAPELLEALKRCIGSLRVVSPGGDTDPDVDFASAAIAKATEAAS